MKIFISLFFICLIISNIKGEEYWQQDVKYLINVDLIPDKHALEGDLTLEYTNNSPDTLKYLYFRAATNSLRPGSYLERSESARGFNRFYRADSSEYGSCRIFNMVDENGAEIEFSADYSIIKVELNPPLLPGAVKTLYLKFSTHLPSPRLAYRMSFINGQFKCAHWYPQICVYDRKLGWVNNQYLGWGENYGDIGTFSVSITAPSDYLIAATGVLQNPDEVLPDTLKNILRRSNFESPNPPNLDFLKNGEKTWRFYAENVSDFAFAADSRFCLDETEYQGIKIQAFIRREHAREWRDAAEIGRQGIEFYSQNFGLYAYPQMTITDSWGGMEFPMLVMCGGYSPEYDLLIWHEIGHNYFMGAVSSNQTDRAFLDEGLTTFLEIAAMEHFLGRDDNLNLKTDWFKRKFLPHEEDRFYRGFRPYLNLTLQGYARPMPLNADSAPEWLVYRVSSYYKPVSMLFALEYILGREMLFKCLSEYHLNWKFKHPYEEDFFDSFENSSGCELTYFFEQWVYTNKKLDYAILPLKLLSVDEGGYKYRITVERKGDLIMPIGFAVLLRDSSVQSYWIPLNDDPAPAGRQILPIWDQLRTPLKTYSVEILLPSPYKSLDLDPEGLLADVNPLNNRQPFPKIQWNWALNPNYPPVNAYQIRHYPLVAYNKIDGLQLGWHFKGSFLEYKDQADVFFGLGLKNFSPDWGFKFITPLSAINPQLFSLIYAFDVNGFRGGDLGFYWNKKPTYSGEAQSGFILLLQHRQHISNDYVFYPQIWMAGEDRRLSWRYWQNLTNFGNFRFEIGGESSFLSPDFSYSGLQGRIDKSLSLAPILNLDLTFSAGTLNGEAIPSQKLFYVSGFNPELDRNYEFKVIDGFYFILNDNNVYTQDAPGISGYHSELYSVKDYLANSSQIRFGSIINRNFKIPFYGDLRPSVQPLLFYHCYYSENRNLPSNFMYEAGPGISISKVPEGVFNLIFPLYLYPALGEEGNFEFRWLVTFNPELKW